MKNSNKYRPVLTAEQIEHILTLAKGSPMTDTNISLIGSLSPFFAKIQNKAVNAAYTTTGNVASSKFSIESLGGTAQPDSEATESKEDFWEICYNQWLITPLEMSLAGIEAANEYRYLHDLMTPEEQTAFETGAPLGELR
tara:strand:+ start:608 stop:1027 length:420 start_codon:yes stop_codon:yes gene_type:complete